MKRGIVILLVFLGCFGVVVPPGAAETKKLHPAQTLLQNTFDTVIGILSQKETPEEKRVEDVIQTVAPLFDFTLMGKLSLGKTNWKRFSDDQRQTFLTQFETRLKTAYIDKIAGYTNETVSFGAIEANGKKVVLPTTITTPDGNVSIIYKMYLKKDTWRVYDVSVKGISLIQSYRQQFNGILKDGTPETLLEKMNTLPDSGTGKNDPASS